MKDYSKATNEQLNAVIARLDGWQKHNDSEPYPYDNLTPYWTKDGFEYCWGKPPDYTGDPRYWAGLLDEYGIGVQPHWDTITERKYWIAHVDIGEQLAGHTTTKCRTPGEAVCLAYLAHKGVMELEEREDWSNPLYVWFCEKCNCAVEAPDDVVAGMSSCSHKECGSVLQLRKQKGVTEVEDA